VMKKVFALLVVAACALPAVANGQMAAEPSKMVHMFSSPLRTDGGTLQVIILNDRTVEALFPTSPAKAAFRSKARMTTVFFVQGNVNRDFEFKPEVTVVQKGETLQGKNSGMKNFTGGKVAKGDQILGLVELPKKLNLYEPFKFTLSGGTADFRLNEDDVRDYGNR
jgi:hypothetical protein